MHRVRRWAHSLQSDYSPLPRANGRRQSGPGSVAGLGPLYKVALNVESPDFHRRRSKTGLMERMADPMDEGNPIVHATRPQAEDATVLYVIDPQGSTFVAQALAMGLLSSFGHSPKLAIRDFKGQLSFSPQGMSIAGARLNISIQADSLEVTDDIAEKDRQEIHRKMREEVLETDRFPEIVYECSRVSASGSGARYWVALNGELTLHGVTRPVPVSALP